MPTPQFSPAELGFPLPPSGPPGDLPPGGGGFTTPNFLTFQALITNASRSYPYTSDKALLASWVNAEAMENDLVLTSAFEARIRPTSQLSWHLDPREETDPSEVEAAALITRVLESTPRWIPMLFSLLRAEWYGKYANELAYEWNSDAVPGERVLSVREYLPVHGDKIRFKWDGTPGFLVYGGFPGTWEATDWGLAHFLTAREREQYLIHQFQPEDANWQNPRLAGGVHGVGLRGKLYWFWWLKQQVFALMMNYLERFSNGLTIFYYAAHDPEALKAAQNAAMQQFSQSAILFPAWNKDGKQINNVQRLEVGTATPALLENLVTSYFDMVMVRAIRGESPYIGPEGQARGGGDMAELASEGLDETVKYDALLLQETVQADFVNVLYKYNCPGVRPGKFSFEIDSPNSEELMKYGQILYEWGVELDEEQAYKLSQWEKPKPGNGVISKLGAMQAAAINAQPQGVPVSGQPGPTDPAQQQPQPDQSMTNGAPMAFRRGAKTQLVSPPRRIALPRRRLTFSRS